MALEQVLKQEIKQLKSAMRNGVKRSKISLAGNDDKKFQLSQIKYFANKIKNTHIIMPYGIAANPPEGEDALTFNVMGQEENTVAIPYATTVRFKNLQKKEVRVGNPFSSASVLFRNDGVASINGSEFEGIIKVIDLTTKLNDYVTEFNSFVTIHNAHQHTETGSVTSAPLTTASNATSFSKSDYENTNVLHGKQGTGTSGGSSGAGEGAVWGNITGTLSNQIDLQAALDAKLSVETDPVFTASPAFGIGSGDITNWDTAFTHSQIVTGNPHSVTKAEVGLSNVENTALSTWAGSTNLTTLGIIGTGTWQATPIADAYIASTFLKNIVEDTTPQLGGDLDTNSNDIKFLDNDKAIFGTGLDAEIYSDGQDLIIRSLTQDRFTRFFGNIGGSDTELVTLDFANQRIGFGTPTPNAFVEIENKLALANTLNVVGQDGGANSVNFSSYGQRTNFNARRYNGTKASPTALLSGDVMFRFGGGGYDGSTLTSNRAQIDFKATENWSGSAQGALMEFQTTPNGSTTKATRLVIDQDGTFDFYENLLDNVGDITHDDSTASDWIFRNEDLDKDIIFNINIGGTPTDILQLDAVNAQSYFKGSVNVDRGAIRFNNEGAGVASRGTVWSSGSTGHAAGFLFIRGRGTESTPASIQSGDSIGYTRYVGYYDSSNNSRQAEIFVNAAENWDASNRGAFICLDATPTGSINRIAHAIFEEGRITLPHTSGVADSSVIKYEEKDTTPANPAIGTEVKQYFKDNKVVYQYNDGGTIRYKYLDMTGTGVTWVHSTTAP